MKSSIAILLLVLSSLGQTAMGQKNLSLSTNTLSLHQAIELGLANHPQLLRAQIEVEAAEARIIQARSRFFPLIDLGGSAKQGLSGAGSALALKGLAGSPFPDDMAISANVTQTLYDFGRTKYGTTARRFELAYLKESVSARRAQIILKVIQAYFEVLQDREAQGASREMVEEKRLMLKQSKSFFRTQLRSQLDVRRAEINFSRAQLKLDRASHQLEQTLASLENAMGLKDPPSGYVLEKPKIEVVNPGSLKELLAEALEGRAELSAMQAQIEATKYWLKKAESERYPHLKAALSIGWANFSNLSLDKLLFGGLGIQLPIFMGNLLSGNIEEARQDLERTNSINKELVNDVRLQVKKAYNDLLSSQESVVVNQAITNQAQEALKLARVRYRLDLSDFVEFTTSETILSTAESDHTQALYNYKIKEAELKYAVGGLK